MKKKTYQRILAMLFVCVMLFALPFSASAKAVDVEKETNPEISEVDAIEPRGFSRTYEMDLSYLYSYVMSDSNWWGEGTVTVSFTAYSTGPQQVEVFVKDKNGNQSDYTILKNGNKKVFKIPAGEFSVYACAVDKKGSAKIGVAYPDDFLGRSLTQCGTSFYLYDYPEDA